MDDCIAGEFGGKFVWPMVCVSCAMKGVVTSNVGGLTNMCQDSS